jgi:hypothetical protein
VEELLNRSGSGGAGSPSRWLADANASYRAAAGAPPPSSWQQAPAQARPPHHAAHASGLPLQLRGAFATADGGQDDDLDGGASEGVEFE